MSLWHAQPEREQVENRLNIDPCIKPESDTICSIRRVRSCNNEEFFLDTIVDCLRIAYNIYAIILIGNTFHDILLLFRLIF